MHRGGAVDKDGIHKGRGNGYTAVQHKVCFHSALCCPHGLCTHDLTQLSCHLQAAPAPAQLAAVPCRIPRRRPLTPRKPAARPAQVATVCTSASSHGEPPPHQPATTPPAPAGGSHWRLLHSQLQRVRSGNARVRGPSATSGGATALARDRALKIWVRGGGGARGRNGGVAVAWWRRPPTAARRPSSWNWLAPPRCPTRRPRRTPAPPRLQHAADLTPAACVRKRCIMNSYTAARTLQTYIASYSMMTPPSQMAGNESLIPLPLKCCPFLAFSLFHSRVLHPKLQVPSISSSRHVPLPRRVRQVLCPAACDWRPLAPCCGPWLKLLLPTTLGNLTSPRRADPRQAAAPEREIKAAR